MAPPSANIDLESHTPTVTLPSTASSGSRLNGPLEYSGISQRGVVFFRDQAIGIDDQKILGQKARHALSNSKRGSAVDENGKLDDEVITFERIPSDYAILKIVKTPEDAGGDTLWASGITATHYQPAFNEVKEKFGEDLIDEFRGAPENTGLDFQAEHPVIRTNPVTGWKTLFGTGHQVHAGWYNGVIERESDILKDYFNQIIFENHDFQVCFRWNQNDFAIWDNRSVFQTATGLTESTTSDYNGKRQGNRVVSLGEKPYFDPASVLRRDALRREK
ncbi:putative TauD/TfdA-like domain-containing protein [Seiridium cardinale]|uniref:TauD/TfdA-like domain-containing protein n=1 Tax=Seiridium cardinale TaxID=138064 RepID=A0ABR2XGX9_9PEZI